MTIACKEQLNAARNVCNEMTKAWYISHGARNVSNEMTKAWYIYHMELVRNACNMHYLATPSSVVLQHARVPALHRYCR